MNGRALWRRWAAGLAGIAVEIVAAVADGALHALAGREDTVWRTDSIQRVAARRGRR